jgi:sterol desaturase/sphingolipid hydroxylase (fatty acid hydroxylase superfamily)
MDHRTSPLRSKLAPEPGAARSFAIRTGTRRADALDTMARMQGGEPTPKTAADTPRTLREALPVFLGHGSPRVLLLAFAAAVAARVALGGASLRDLVPIVVIAVGWPLLEWAIHVVILHAKPVRIGRFTFDGRVPRKHRAHHRDPWNTELVFIPFHSCVYALPIVVGLCFLLTPDAKLALTALAFFLLLAIHYEAVHFLVHTRVAPRGRYYQALWRNHRLHHFKNEREWFGVTRLEADRLLGTAPAAEGVPTSPTARTLGVAPPS